MVPYSVHVQVLGVQTLMVVRAQQDVIVHAGLSVAGPESDMMNLAPGGGPVASGHGTSAISGKDSSADRFRKLSLFSPDR